MLTKLGSIFMVLFTKESGEKTQVNMARQEFAHLLFTFKREKASPFRDGFVWEKDGEKFHYSHFGLLSRGGRSFELEYSVN